jgi:hypothetical protein
MRWIYLLALAAALSAEERQLTTAPRTHALDNNDNFSPDDRFLCFDTRETEIWKVDVRTGVETLLFGKGPKAVAASYHPTRDEVIFIHGPVAEPYFKSNRRGAIVTADGSLRFLDTRDVASPVTPAGAHRGGTHRHEYSLNGKRVGFTYDDQLLPTYGRTIGMVQDGKFAVLVPVVPEAAAKPGDIVMAASDSWVGREGVMRAFIGRVKEADGGFRNSLFVADVPASVDMGTASAGDAKRFPSPPRGVRVRRLTTTEVSGIVRGSRDGKFIAYLAAAPDNTKQVFVVPSAGGAARQLTSVPGGVQAGIRWHPAGKFVAVSTGQGIAVTQFSTGKTVFLTKKGGDALVWSNDGKTLAFNRKVGEHAQIFLVDFSVDGF